MNADLGADLTDREGLTEMGMDERSGGVDVLIGGYVADFAERVDGQLLLRQELQKHGLQGDLQFRHDEG